MEPQRVANPRCAKPFARTILQWIGRSLGLPTRSTVARNRSRSRAIARSRSRYSVSDSGRCSPEACDHARCALGSRRRRRRNSMASESHRHGVENARRCIASPPRFATPKLIDRKRNCQGAMARHGRPERQPHAACRSMGAARDYGCSTWISVQPSSTFRLTLAV